MKDIAKEVQKAVEKDGLKIVNFETMKKLAAESELLKFLKGNLLLILFVNNS